MDSKEYCKKYYWEHKHPCLVCSVLVAPESLHCRKHAPKPDFTLEHRQHLGEARREWYANPENRQKMREIKKREYANPVARQRLLENSKKYGFKKGMVQPWTGKTWDEYYGVEKASEMRKKISISAKERYDNNPEIRDIMAVGRLMGCRYSAEAMKRLWATPEFRDKMLKAREHFHTTEKGAEYRLHLSELMRAYKLAEWADKNHTYNTLQYRAKLSEGSIKQWEHDEYAIKWMKANARKPNKQEMRLSYLLRSVCPHIFRYNGDARLGLVFGGKTPDFVNVNGKKQVIELLGNWWHGEKRTGRTKDEEETRLINHYKQFGFRCLPIWEMELDNKMLLKQRIKEFACA